MYATYHLKADELNADLIQSLKDTFHQREIVILPKDEYDEWETVRRNAAFTEELQNRIKELDEGKGIVKTMAVGGQRHVPPLGILFLGFLGVYFRRQELVIAHRLRTVAGADTIVVLDKGHVVKQSAHEELMAQDGLYRKLYTIQTESLSWSL